MPGSDGQRIWVYFWKTQLKTRCPIESQRQTEGFGPSMTHGLANQPRWEKSTAGQYSSLSPSAAHLSHTTNINPFENKMWEIYFYKEVCSFVHWSSSLLLTMFPLIFVYALCSCMWLYNKLIYGYALLLALLNWIHYTFIYTFFVLLFFNSFCTLLNGFYCILTFDPAKHAIPKTRKLHIPLA